MSKKRVSPKSVQQGVAIIEAMIAILIFSVGVLGIIGMQASMIRNTADSRYRSDAAFIAQQRIGEMWTNLEPVANLDSYIMQEDISALLPGGQRNVTKSSTITDYSGTVVGGVFTVTVGWTAPGETPAANSSTAPCFMAVAHCFTTTANISGG